MKRNRFLRNITFIAGMMILSGNLFSQAPCISKVWVADNGDGTYKNPIINADFDWFRIE